MIRVYSTPSGLVLESAGRFLQPTSPLAFDTIFGAAAPLALVRAAYANARPASMPTQLLAPLQSQEIWAAGVTYLRSKTARMAESKDAGGGTFYN